MLKHRQGQKGLRGRSCGRGMRGRKGQLHLYARLEDQRQMMHRVRILNPRPKSARCFAERSRLSFSEPLRSCGPTLPILELQTSASRKVSIKIRDSARNRMTGSTICHNEFALVRNVSQWLRMQPSAPSIKVLVSPACHASALGDDQSNQARRTTTVEGRRVAVKR